ncbi:SatD family protein [Candidatus Formimonas warabiya]|uniref:SatD family (SatD) n=1 Tax=Formimonas warabiya TaxID=1761012 RepID=A0A3G1KWN0_FORW1|nr:SatD family protein [Candidatus Formimonas warabiya]ATW26943.1 hypothetical protein DCMF_21220 [Candidatus Formimonas warabiya]
MGLFGVINMDIVNSRKMKERKTFQNNLLDFIETMNQKYLNTLLVAPIRIILGDEWQIVLKKPAQCYRVIHEFQQFLWQSGLEAYAGFSIGTISTEVFDDNRIMDGPVFVAAREALLVVKKNAKNHAKSLFSKRNRVFLYDGEYPYLYLERNMAMHSEKSAFEEVAAALEPESSFPSVSDRLLLVKIINLLIENNEILKEKMSPKQKDTYIKYFNSPSYRRLSEELKESTSSISQKLNIAEYFTIQRNHQMVSQLLELYGSLRRE